MKTKIASPIGVGSRYSNGPHLLHSNIRRANVAACTNCGKQIVYFPHRGHDHWRHSDNRLRECNR